MCDHGHGNGGHGGCASHAQTFDYGGTGMEYHMANYIDKDKVVVLNESVEGSGVKVFKAWDNRIDRTDYVESDVDPELLFNIPFTGHVKITGITLIGDLDESHPSDLRIFKDREIMSFSDVANAKPDQQMKLKQDDSGQIDYPLIAAKFSNVHHLTLYFPTNFGADVTRIFYIGLRGDFQHNFREKAVIATYESRPMADDHKAEIPDAAHHHIC